MSLHLYSISLQGVMKGAINIAKGHNTGTPLPRHTRQLRLMGGLNPTKGTHSKAQSGVGCADNEPRHKGFQSVYNTVFKVTPMAQDGGL